MPPAIIILSLWTSVPERRTAITRFCNKLVRVQRRRKRSVQRAKVQRLQHAAGRGFLACGDGSALRLPFEQRWQVVIDNAHIHAHLQVTSGHTQIDSSVIEQFSVANGHGYVERGFERLHRSVVSALRAPNAAQR
jgi:hypothetical protein